MQLSYQEIGQWCATFACSGVKEGDPVTMTGSRTVGACNSGEPFCGVAVSLSHGGDACAVQLGGLVTVPYSGEAPVSGYASLSSDGSGGVSTDPSGRDYLVVEVNTADETVTIAL